MGLEQIFEQRYKNHHGSSCPAACRRPPSQAPHTQPLHRRFLQCWTSTGLALDDCYLSAFNPRLGCCCVSKIIAKVVVVAADEAQRFNRSVRDRAVKNDNGDSGFVQLFNCGRQTLAVCGADDEESGASSSACSTSCICSSLLSAVSGQRTLKLDPFASASAFALSTISTQKSLPICLTSRTTCISAGAFSSAGPLPQSVCFRQERLPFWRLLRRGRVWAALLRSLRLNRQAERQ